MKYPMTCYNKYLNYLSKFLIFFTLFREKDTYALPQATYRLYNKCKRIIKEKG